LPHAAAADGLECHWVAILRQHCRDDDAKEVVNVLFSTEIIVLGVNTARTTTTTAALVNINEE